MLHVFKKKKSKEMLFSSSWLEDVYKYKSISR